MDRKRMAACALTLAFAAPLPFAPVDAQPANQAAELAIPAALTGRYDVRVTNLGMLLDDPAAKAVIDNRIPGLSSEPQIDLGRSLTLLALMEFVPDRITTETLVAIQTDLNTLPPKA
ncbi:hypothetical protein [Sphingomonas sp. 35-24ZXX]|uniref:hypothetical protein n=1 Tax=Sphingomonas sp. 35-24ZXX TaxID=1545915 RepID=UPI0012E055CC|nr:hypothetical protein [Sphingomonas sp. 35-24ZXX]